MTLRVDLEKVIEEFRSSLGWVLSDLYAPLGDPMKSRWWWARALGMTLGISLMWASGMVLSFWLLGR